MKKTIFALSLVLFTLNFATDINSNELKIQSYSGVQQESNGIQHKRIIINTVLENSEKDTSNWNSSAQQSTKAFSGNYSILLQGDNYYIFKVPEKDQNFSYYRQLSCYIKLLSEKKKKTTLKFRLKEKSNELWETAPQPLSNNYTALKASLQPELFNLTYNRIYNNGQLDLDQITEIHFKIESLNNPTTDKDNFNPENHSILIDNLTLHPFVAGSKTTTVDQRKIKATTYQSIKINNITDSERPTINNIYINNKEIIAGDYVYSYPKIKLNISEINSGLTTWNITIFQSDVTKNSYTNYVNLITGNSIEVSYSITTALDDGEYYLKATVYDAKGNSHSKNSPSFIVVSKLSIKDLLNGPNPFNPLNEKTNIQYQLSLDADVDIYIYTISGERIWQQSFTAGISNGGTSGFNSITWDGYNNWNEIVANGVYIVYLVAKKDGKKTFAKTKILVLK